MIILRNNARSALQNSQAFNRLSKVSLERVMDCFQIKKVKQGEVVVDSKIKTKNLIFFIAEGGYELSKDCFRTQLYG